MNREFRARNDRHQLHAEQVSRERFLRLMLSRDRLVRLDDAENGRRGLRDESGHWFVISEQELVGRRLSTRKDRHAE